VSMAAPVTMRIIRTLVDTPASRNVALSERAAKPATRPTNWK
jgi:hypothetical protein